MNLVEYAPDWLLQKLNEANPEEVTLIARVLWGIWFFRNKRVWENKIVNDRIVMEWSASYFAEWRKAKESKTVLLNNGRSNAPTGTHKWKAPTVDYLKLNTDAAIKLGENSFSVGLVLRDHRGEFIGGKVKRLQMANSVLEAEVIAIKEGLHWLSTLPHQFVEIESDSLLSVKALNHTHNNALEVGFMLDECRDIIRSRPGFSIIFAKRQANKAAHLMARLPCLLDCQSIFTSLPSIFPSMLVETLLYDISS